MALHSRKSSKWTFLLLVVLLWCASYSTALAESAKPKSARELLGAIFDGVESFKLRNGLRVILYRRPHAPVFAGQIWVKVGGVNEVPGTTGAAHMLEHMAFKGSKVIGTKNYQKEKELLAEYQQLLSQGLNEKTQARAKQLQEALEDIWINNEFSQIYTKRGAVGLNAATGKDYTMYMVNLPNTAFELWAWMESDRLLNPVFRQFYKEREVVREERRSRTDDSPGGRLYEALLASAFWMHPYRLPVIGWPSDLRELEVSDITELYNRYYRPDNMVIALVGDLNPKTVKPVLERYFGRVPAAKGPLPEIELVEEPQNGRREAVVHFDADPRFSLAYHKPVYPHKDDLKFAVLHSLLSDGRSSVFNKELVQDKQLASSVSSSEAPGELYSCLFYVWAVPRRGVTNERLYTAVVDILNRLKEKPVSEADLSAAKKRVKVDILNGMNSNYGLARTLAHAELLWGDWRVLIEMYDAIIATTKEDIQTLAKRYFRTENETFVRLEKPKS